MLYPIIRRRRRHLITSEVPAPATAPDKQEATQAADTPPGDVPAPQIQASEPVTSPVEAPPVQSLEPPPAAPAPKVMPALPPRTAGRGQRKVGASTQELLAASH